MRKVALVICLVVFAGHPLGALAISDSDREHVNKDKSFHSDSDGTVCTIDTSVSLAGNDNAEKIFNYLTQAPNGPKFTGKQAAGMMGNWWVESAGTMDPRVIQGSPPKFGDDIVSGLGYGLAQWTDSGRQQGLRDYAKRTGGKVGDLAVQLGYAYWELTHGYQTAFHDIKADQGTPSQVAITIMKEYEQPGTKHEDWRTHHADEYYRLYGGGGGGTPPADGGATPPADDSGSDLSSCATATGTGQNTAFIDGFTVYAQYDPQWKNRPYGDGTIGRSGCGPSAMAMIITALTGKKVTPPETSSYADSKNQYEPGVGSRWTIAPVLAEHWGLKSKAIGADVQKITQALQAGQLVVTSGQGALPFTSGGHYIVIRAVTADGKWRIGDSGHGNTSDKDWDPNKVIQQMNGGSVYAISK
jgi:hypothetical protein